MISLKTEKISLKQEKRKLLLSNLSNAKIRVNQINIRLAQIKVIESRGGK